MTSKYQHAWAAWGKLEGSYTADLTKQEIIMLRFPVCPSDRGMHVWQVDIVGRPWTVESMTQAQLLQWYYDTLGVLWTVHSSPQQTEHACGVVMAPPVASVSLDLALPLHIVSGRAPYVTVRLPPKWLGRPQGWQVGCTLRGTWVKPAAANLAGKELDSRSESV